jgi:hypothetical protein
MKATVIFHIGNGYLVCGYYNLYASFILEEPYKLSWN